MEKTARVSSLPSPVDEESLASWLDRVFVHSDNFHRRTNCSKVLGQPWRNLAAPLPFRLREFADQVGHRFYSDADLLHRHTFYPYFAATFSGRSESELVRHIFEGRRGPLCPAREPASLLARPNVKRRCPSCEANDRALLGFQVERRYNVAPFLTRCPFHGDFLSAVGGDLERKLLSFRLAESDSAATQRNAKQFARNTQELLEGRSPTLAMCRRQLKELGFVTPGGSLRTKSLVEALIEHFADGFEDQALTQLVTDKIKLTRTLKRMSRARGSIHPTFLVLLNMFVEVQALAPSAETNAGKAFARGHEDLDASVLADCKSVRALARKLGIATTTASLLLKRSGYADRFKLKSRDEADEAVRNALKSGLSVHAIANQHGMSALSVYRLMRETPGLIELRREKHERAELEVRRARATATRLQGNGVITVSEFRKNYRPDYQWLFRNDREWLRVFLDTLKSTERRPTRRKRSLTAEDTWSEGELLQLAYEVVTQDSESRPYRASRQRVANVLDLSSYAVKARESLGTSLPSEQDEQFVVRRLRWANKALSTDLYGCSPTARIKQMGLRNTERRRAVCVVAHGEGEFDAQS